MWDLPPLLHWSALLTVGARPTTSSTGPPAEWDVPPLLHWSALLTVDARPTTSSTPAHRPMWDAPSLLGQPALVTAEARPPGTPHRPARPVAPGRPRYSPITFTTTRLRRCPSNSA